MSQPYSINLSTSRSTHPQPSSLLLLHLPSSCTPAHLPAFSFQLTIDSTCPTLLLEIHTLKTHTLSHTLIKQQFSGCLFSRYTSKIKSPAGENWGRGKSETLKQLNYKNNAARLIGFPSKFALRYGMNLRGEKWGERLEDSKRTKGCFSVLAS